MDKDEYIDNKMPNAQQAVWRQSGCLFGDTSVVIWKLTVRRSLSETPPERQATGRWLQRGTVRWRQRSAELKLSKK